MHDVIGVLHVVNEHGANDGNVFLTLHHACTSKDKEEEAEGGGEDVRSEEREMRENTMAARQTQKEADEDGDKENSGEMENEPWEAAAIRGIGSTMDCKLYVVWNMESEHDAGFCEVTWTSIMSIKNLAQLCPSGSPTHPLKREDLKFGGELVGRRITGTFKFETRDSDVEDGEELLEERDEDGVVKSYDESKHTHVVQWDGGTNVGPTQEGKGEMIKHQLMLTSKTMQLWNKRKKSWSQSREILIRWYLDEPESAYEYPPQF